VSDAREQEEEYPVLEASPGMTMAETAAASTVLFRVPSENEEPCLAQPHVPHRFRLRDPARGFDAPAGLFSVLEATRGVIFRLRATPHVGYIAQREAIALFGALADRIESKRWLRRLRRELGDLAKRLDEAGEDKAGDWLGDEWVCEIWIRLAVKKDSNPGRLMQLDDDAYLTTLLIWDIRRAAERIG
jgi:hypothetical protein